MPPHPIHIHLEGGGSIYLQNVDIHWEYDISLNPEKDSLKEGKPCCFFDLSLSVYSCTLKGILTLYCYTN